MLEKLNAYQINNAISIFGGGSSDGTGRATDNGTGRATDEGTGGAPD
jgi:hypothetical protein